MNIALRKPRMSRDELFDCTAAQDARNEFDRFRPVAVTGGGVLKLPKIGIEIPLAGLFAGTDIASATEDPA